MTSFGWLCTGNSGVETSNIIAAIVMFAVAITIIVKMKAIVDSRKGKAARMFTTITLTLVAGWLIIIGIINIVFSSFC